MFYVNPETEKLIHMADSFDCLNIPYLYVDNDLRQLAIDLSLAGFETEWDEEYKVLRITGSSSNWRRSMFWCWDGCLELLRECRCGC